MTAAAQAAPVEESTRVHEHRFKAAFASIKTSLIRPADPEGNALADELRRLREARFLFVADLVERSTKTNMPAAGEGMFPPGDVHAAVFGTTLLMVKPEEVEALLARHTSGDSGMFGDDWSKITPSDAQRISPATFGVAVANAVALASGSGIIRSRYSLFDPVRDRPKPEDSNEAVSRRRRCEGEWLEIATLLQPNRPTVTLVFTAVDHITPPL